MFAATPPLEAKKSLFSMAITQFARGRAKSMKGTQKLLFIDVRRAYVYAPARRPVYVTLPDEDAEEGMCGRLNRSMYGTRDAAANWEDKYSSHLESMGFARGKSSPCTFFHLQRGIRCVVHGDDFTFLANESELKWCTDMMKAEYEVKVRGLLGPDKHDDKQMTILNRCIEWRKNEIWYEADPRHAEILVRELGLKDKRPVVTPGINTVIKEGEDDPHLDGEFSTKYRQIIARCNFITQDRPDAQYSVKEAAKGMANPRKSDREKLIRIGKYLLGKPRYVIKLSPQKDIDPINAYGDSDFAGDLTTRKSTSGGLACLGDHVVKSWSSSQSIIALSTGEAELYALNKASATAMGLKSLLWDLGVDLEIKVFTDATTGKALAVRRGLGKLRQAVSELWIQEKVHDGVLKIVKIKNKFNPADLMTKHLSQAEISHILEQLDHIHAEGRSQHAPELALVDGPDSHLLRMRSL